MLAILILFSLSEQKMKRVAFYCDPCKKHLNSLRQLLDHKQVNIYFISTKVTSQQGREQANTPTDPLVLHHCSTHWPA